MGLIVSSLQAQQSEINYNKVKLDVSYYSTNIVGFNLNLLKFQEHEIATELKMFANRQFKYLSAEMDIFYNFKQQEYHRFAIGAGLKLDPFTDGGNGAAFVIPLQLLVYPLMQNRRISVLMELAPEFYFEDVVSLRSVIGFRYSYGK